MVQPAQAPDQVALPVGPPPPGQRVAVLVVVALPLVAATRAPLEHRQDSGPVSHAQPAPRMLALRTALQHPVGPTLHRIFQRLVNLWFRHVFLEWIRWPGSSGPDGGSEIGRASCRERVVE